MKSTRLGLALVVGALGLIGLVGCGPAATGTAGNAAASASGESVAISEDASAEALALAAIGFDPIDLAADAAAPADVVPVASTAPAAGTSASAGAARHPKLRRLALRRGTLHGEFTVRTRDHGDKVVAVQRGTVTSVSGGSVTVTSADGFAQTWALADQVRVVKERAKADPSAITTGATVGVAGVKDGGQYRARLVVIPKKP